MKEQMMFLAEYANEFEAEIARGHLKSAGIYAILSRDDAGGMLPSLQEVEGVTLLVRPVDLKRARVILHEKSTTKQPS